MAFGYCACAARAVEVVRSSAASSSERRFAELWGRHREVQRDRLVDLSFAAERGRPVQHRLLGCARGVSGRALIDHVERTSAAGDLLVDRDRIRVVPMRHERGGG
jgi:hypothetical protein